MGKWWTKLWYIPVTRNTALSVHGDKTQRPRLATNWCHKSSTQNVCLQTQVELCQSRDSVQTIATTLIEQIEVFKILNGYENIDSNIFFEIKESKITRGHNYTLVKKQSRLDVRKYSFSQRTINVSNNLSTDCVHASSVNMFKNKIDKYLVKAGYT